MLPDTLTPFAKAIAGFLTPIVLAIIAKILIAAGVDIPVDPGAVETAVTSIVTAALVWRTRNRSPELEEALIEIERLRALIRR